MGRSMVVDTIKIECEEGLVDVQALILPCGLAIHPMEPKLHTFHRTHTVVYSVRVAITHIVSGRKVAAAHTIELAKKMCQKLRRIDWKKSLEEMAGGETIAANVKDVIWWHCEQMEKLRGLGIDVRCKVPVTLDVEA